MLVYDESTSLKNGGSWSFLRFCISACKLQIFRLRFNYVPLASLFLHPKINTSTCLNSSLSENHGKHFYSCFSLPLNHISSNKKNCYLKNTNLGSNITFRHCNNTKSRKWLICLKTAKILAQVARLYTQKPPATCPTILPFLKKMQGNFEPFESFLSFVKKYKLAHSTHKVWTLAIEFY